MATLTFEVEVDEKTAERVRQSEEERIKIKYLIKRSLQANSRVDVKVKILQIMDDMSREAEKNGLTDEKLAKILEEIDKERT